MKAPIKIGNIEFKSKKEALLYFREILNSYNFGESLSEAHKKYVSALVYKTKGAEKRVKSGIKDIKIGKVQYGTKCFEIIFNQGENDTFSYILAINGNRKPLTKFIIACRNEIQEDLRNVKQKYFGLNSKNGKVKCQETGILSSWAELNVDHRQPNTLSIIIDRFIELYKIDINKIDYKKDNDNKIIFSDRNLAERFRTYHKEKANLRIIRKERNLSRSHQGRVKQQKKDLKI